MPVPIDPTSLLPFLAGGAALGFVGLLFVAAQGPFRRPQRFRRKIQGSRTEVIAPCHYCRWGQSLLVEERTSREGGETVEVRCFACVNCGLPHWTIRRIPRTELAGR